MNTRSTDCKADALTTTRRLNVRLRQTDHDAFSRSTFTFVGSKKFSDYNFQQNLKEELFQCRCAFGKRKKLNVKQRRILNAAIAFSLFYCALVYMSPIIGLLEKILVGFINPEPSLALILVFGPGKTFGKLYISVLIWL